MKTLVEIDPILRSQLRVPHVSLRRGDLVSRRSVRALAALLTFGLSVGWAADLDVNGALTLSAGDSTYEGWNVLVGEGDHLTVNGPHSFADVTVSGNGQVTYSRQSAGDFLGVNSLLMSGTATLSLGGGTVLQATESITLSESSRVVVLSVDYSGRVGGQWAGAGSQLSAGGNIIISRDASVSADAQGYGSAGWYDEPGVGPGAGGGGSYSGGGGGGGHGGAGGRGRIGAGGGAYGSWDMPVALGSGAGSGWNGYGYRRAGGAIRLTTPSLVLEGVISANGQDGSTDVGGGAGGSIWVEASLLSGGGRFTANGGIGAGTCGSGGGGRIAVHCVDRAGFTSPAASTAAGGNGGWSSGGDGSVAFIQSNLSPPDVDVFTSFHVTSPVSAGELRLMSGAKGSSSESLNVAKLQAPSQNTLVLAAAAIITQGTLGEGSSVDCQQGLQMTTFEVGGAGSLRIGGGRKLEGGSLLVKSGGMVVAQTINYAGQVDGVWAGTGAEIDVTSIEVEAGGFILADGEGYGSAGWYDSPGVGPGAGSGGSYSGGGGGGGYGGAGGNGHSGAGGGSYGDVETPTALGSGAGSGWNGYGYYRGGGALRIVTDSMVLNGIISANGQDGGTDVGGGAGGSILVQAGTLTGAGIFQSNGGAGAGSCGGGGGGRVALHCVDSSGFSGLEQSTVRGGPGWQAGSDGTIYPAGSVAVTLSPAAAVTAGAKWSLDGMTWRDAGAIMAPPGPLTLRFAAVAGWKTPADQTVEVTQSGRVTVSGVYEEIVYHAVTYTAGVFGSLVGPASQQVEYGTNSTQVTAMPDLHYRFVNWSDGSVANPRVDENVTGPVSVTANFAVITHAIDVTSSPEAGGQVTGGGVLEEGSQALLTATANSGWRFLGWFQGQALAWPGAQWSFEVTSARTLEARFEVLALGVAPGSVETSLAGQIYSIAVSSNTDWTVSEHLDWAVVEPSSGSGDATVAVTLQENLSALSRSGVIRFTGFEVPDVDHSITQLGGAIKLSHAHAAFAKTTARSSVGVTTSHYHLAWTAVSNDPSWLHITTGGNGSGNGTVGFTVDAYTGTVPRKGTLTIGGRTFTVMQSVSKPAGQLTVKISGTGLGTVSGAKLNTALTKTVGSRVTLTAKPASGHRFAGWTGSGFIFLPGAEKRAALTFVMGETVELTAAFEAEPYSNGLLAGNYAGLAAGTDPSDLTANGACKLTLTKTGAFTCVLRTPGGSYTGRGALAADGAGTALVTRLGREPVLLAIQFQDHADPTPDTATIEARLASEIGPVLWNTVGTRLYIAPKGGGHAAAGTYTALFGLAPASRGPFGDGYATLSLAKSGAVRVAGKLPDGIALTTSSSVDLASTWTLYAPLYRNKGLVAGQVALIEPLPATAMTAAVHWIKLPVAPTVKDNYYRSGFDLTAQLSAEPYLPPVRYATALQVLAQAPNVLFEAGGGGLITNPLARSVTLTTNSLGTANLFKVPVTVPADPAKLTLTLNGKTGLFTASLTALFDPASTIGKRITGQGVLMQGSNYGAGVFRGPGQAGALVLEPLPQLAPEP